MYYFAVFWRLAGYCLFLLQSFSGDIVRCWVVMPFIQVVSSRKDWHENNNQLLKSSNCWVSSIQWYRFLLNILSSLVLGDETSVEYIFGYKFWQMFTAELWNLVITKGFWICVLPWLIYGNFTCELQSICLTTCEA
jgi:hypothetical protein